MEHTVDVAVIGAGPAGTSCGIELAKNAISSLIVEKRTFPRDKTCGGLMTKKTYDLLTSLVGGESALPPDLFCDVSDEIALYYRNERLTFSRVSIPYRSVRRLRYDAFLAERYKEAGGTLLEGRVCASVDPDSHTLTLDDGDTVRFRRLVAADGAFSPTAKALGYEPPQLGFCVETHVPKPGREDDGVLHIHFGVPENGYAWRFPSGGELCVGLGGLYDKEIRYDEILMRFLEENGLEADRSRIKGAFIPFGVAIDQRRGNDDVVLVGDAAGYIDPLTGEGLYFSLASGTAAARAAAKSASGGSFRALYLKETAFIQKIVSQGKKTRDSFYANVEKDSFRERMSGRNGFAAYYCDKQLAEYGYPYSMLWKLGIDYKTSK